MLRRGILLAGVVGLGLLTARAAAADQPAPRAATSAAALTAAELHALRNLPPRTRVASDHYYEPAPQVNAADADPNAADYVRWYHPAYLLGTCSICHTRDDKENPGELRAGINRLCLSCHEPIRDMLGTRMFTHQPVTEDCTYCHNPHSSRYRVLLHASPNELCVRCHTGLGKLLGDVAVRHDPVFKGNTCLNCHTEHASSIDNLLQGLPSHVCLGCHGADNLMDSAGVPLGNLARKLARNRYRHEPVDKQDCSVCHEAHGGANFRLLNAAYPDGFYADYDKRDYALCLGCHDRERALSEPRTTTLTGFRDGDRNLHSAHVVEPARGRTCRACHGEHASEQAHLIRKTVPYGAEGWELPINFVPTPNGGRCVKSCHVAEEYDNGGGYGLRHVAMGDQVPRVELETLSGRAAPTLSTAHDVNVFVFFEPNHEHSREALDILARIAREFAGRSVHSVAVVSDFYSRRVEVKWLEATGWTRDRTLVDQGDRYYNQLGQYMYPSFWITDRRLALVAYEPFTGTNYYQRIEALVRRTLGEIDDDQLAAALNPPPEQDLDGASRARMNVTYARKLIEADKLDQALSHGLRALEIDPALVEARGLVCLLYARTAACDLAAPSCAAALAAEPDNADARQGRALCPKRK